MKTAVTDRRGVADVVHPRRRDEQMFLVRGHRRAEHRGPDSDPVAVLQPLGQISEQSLSHHPGRGDERN